MVKMGLAAHNLQVVQEVVLVVIMAAMADICSVVMVRRVREEQAVAIMVPMPF
jgi:hypothetical protein